MKKIYFLVLMVLVANVVWGQQVIGAFPQMDGGYESQAVGALVNTTVATGVQRTDWTVQSATGTRTLSATGGRSGPKYVTFGTSSATPRRLQSPTAAAGAIVNASPYTVQYFYKTPGVIDAANGQAASSPDGTGLPGSYATTSLNYTNGVWAKVTTAITSGSSAAAPKYGVGIIRFNGLSNVDIDIDDFVMYAGGVDNTAPLIPGTVTVNTPTNSKLNVSWTAASGGVDGGGYVVVRYAGTAPGATDDPLQNGIYAVGNTVAGGVNGTVAYIGTGLGFTDVGLASATTYYYKVYTVDKAFNYSPESEGNGTTTATVPNIVLTSSNPAVAAGNIAQGSTSATNNPIYRFDLVVTSADATLNGVTITTAGTYTTAGVTNFKCWYSADAVFDPGTDVLLSTLTPVATAGAQVFPSFATQTITDGSTGYIFVTADLTCAAVVGNTISVNAIAIADVSFVSGNKTGTAQAGGLQTIIAATPNDVTTPAASVANASSSLSWVNPTGCYDEILIVARASAANDGIPTGDGTAYTDNLAFGSGTALGSGSVVYKGTTSPQVVTALTNGTPYFYKFFTRLGTTWSAGVEISQTPSLAAEPTLQATAVTFTNVNATSFKINWVLGDGTNSIVLVKDASAVDSDPVDGTTYTANTIFGSGTQIGTGNFVVYKSTLNNVTVTGLTNGHTYYVAVYTFNGFGGTENYLITTPATGSQLAATVAYYSQSSSDPTVLANWNTLRGGGGAVPTAFTDGDFVIQNTHNMTTSTTWSVGATGTTLEIESGGTLTATSAVTITSGSTFKIDGGGNYVHNNAVPFGSTIFNGTEDFAATSNVEIQSYNTTGPTGVVFGNLIINNTVDQGGSIQCGGGITTINGNFTLQNIFATREFRFSASTALNLAIAGDFIVQNGVLDFASSAGAGVSRAVSIGGNYNQTGGTVKCSGTSNPVTITMTGIGKTFTRSGGTFTSTNLNWIIASGASITLANNLPTSTGRSILVTGTLDASTLQITGAGAVTVNGTLRTANTAGLELTGTLANSGTKTLGAASTIDYYAAGPQIFSTRTDYANVSINGGNNKTLNGVATGSGLFTFNSGYLVSTPLNLLTLTNTASVTGVSNASFVDGPIKKVGNTDFTFPVGKTGVGYVPIGISTFVGGLATDEFTAEYKRASARALGPVNAGAGLDHVSKCDYWTLDKGTATPVSVDVTGYWNANNPCGQAGSYIDDLSKLTLAHFNGVLSEWDLYALTPIITGGSTTTTGSITWPVVAVFSPFSLASTTFGSNPLPINVNYLNGTRQNSNHLLNWKVTCVSTPAVNIELERSSDGRNYSSIYSVYATALRCNQPFNYTDNQPLKGINYYRLKMTDVDGKITYSTTVPLINDTKGFDVMDIAPNPVVNGAFTLKISTAEKTNMEIVITDMQGRILQKQKLNLIAGFNQIPMQVGKLAAGTYQLFGYTADGKTRVLRFVIQ